MGDQKFSKGLIIRHIPFWTTYRNLSCIRHDTLCNKLLLSLGDYSLVVEARLISIRSLKVEVIKTQEQCILHNCCSKQNLKGGLGSGSLLWKWSQEAKVRGSEKCMGKRGKVNIIVPFRGHCCGQRGLISARISKKCVAVAQLLSHTLLFATPWTAAPRFPCPPLSPRVCSDSFPLSQWCYRTISSPAALFFAFNLSQHQGLFQWVSSHQVAKYRSFSRSISPSNEYSRSLFFRTDSFDRL